MPFPSLALSAAIRVLRGELDLDAARPALGDVRLARIIALAPDVHAVVRAVAALCGGCPSLLDPAMIDDPALHDALVRLIGSREGTNALWTWAQIAPAGWGESHAAAILAAVRNGTCAYAAAAALIGPCDQAAALVITPGDIAFAIRRWGCRITHDPTWWIGRLSASAWRATHAALHRDVRDVARCLPWLPRDEEITRLLAPSSCAYVMQAFAAASDPARRTWADAIGAVVRAAPEDAIGDLARLAAATSRSDAWDAVLRLIATSPDAARHVVMATPWDVLPDDVQRVMVTHATQSAACAAIAHARGSAPPPPTTDECCAFFAALDPDVWATLDAPMRRAWCMALSERGGRNAWLAVRSLGPRPDLLALANVVDDEIVAAVRGHEHEESSLRDALFPLALRDLFLSDAYDVMAALPRVPRDPTAFVMIAGGVDARACPRRAATPADLAACVTVQRVASGASTIDDRCDALTEALRQRTWDDVHALMDALPDSVRMQVLPDRDALSGALSRPRRRAALCRALDDLAALPPESSLVARYALSSLAATDDPYERRLWGYEIARALHAHGRLFASLFDALDAPFRAAILPPPAGAALATALRRGTGVDPPSVVRLAHALHMQSWKEVVRALLMAPSEADACALIMALPRSLRAAWADVAADWASSLAAVEQRDAVRRLCCTVAASDPVALLALMALASDDPDDHAHGMHMLSRRIGTARVVLPLLRQDVRRDVCMCDALHLAIADMDIPVADVHGKQVRRLRR